MTPDQPELDFSATEEEIVFDDEECELCSGDPPEQGERQFRRELFEWVKRRAFYHGIDVDAVRSALDELASVADRAWPPVADPLRATSERQADARPSERMDDCLAAGTARVGPDDIRSLENSPRQINQSRPT